MTAGGPWDLTDRDAGPLVVRTVELDAAEARDLDLAALLPAADPVAWLRRGDGLVGWGVAASITTDGPDRFAEADAWWTATVAHAVVRDDVGVPGTGPVCFGTFTFADDVSTTAPPPGAAADARHATSTLVVPEVVVGRRGGRTWLTTASRIGLDHLEHHLRPAEPARPVGEVRFADGARDATSWKEAVTEAVRRIGAGELEKVVLARDLLATADGAVDVRWPLGRLAAAYPTCWTFHVDGMLGATPEMLVRRERGLVTSRVLAGTIRRTGDDAHDLALAATLARSSKDLEEHEYAVRSVAEALGPSCSSTNVPEAPFVLHLPNVMHLATDVTGVVAGDGGSSLALAAALHPSAAVGGTPTDAAVRLIAELEGMSRGRYAGPVGWMDATGDGEWGLALRSAAVEDRTVRLFAGCGIVAGSDPDAELAEAHAKFVPMRDALGG